VGLIADYARRADFSSAKAGDTLILVGGAPGGLGGELGASMYLRECLGREDGAPPPVDLAAEKRHGDFVRNLILSGQVSAVHDLSDGGLAAALAEMALASGVGAQVRAPEGATPVGWLFGEDQGRYLIAARGVDALLAAAEAAEVPARAIGEVGGEAVACVGLFSVGLEALRAAHEGWMPRYMGG
jgi:phosphoribosylformylglycinamidine synthase